MTSARFQCDRAALPADWDKRQWDRCETLNHLGSGAELSLRLANLSHALLSHVDAHAADLVRIASYVYAADQMVSRGGDRDVYGVKWKRRMALAIPVTDPGFWNDAGVVEQLQSVLEFLSEDAWEFHFTLAASEAERLMLHLPADQLHGHPESVFLFSGGADSLSAIVEAVHRHNARPVLVSHSSNPAMGHLQTELVAELRKRFGSWAFPHINLLVSRAGKDAAETSQRTRSFLFASFGTAVAHGLGLSSVFLSDNGFVSINPPINAQLIGAVANRSTHPKFLWLFNRLIAQVLDNDIRVANSLRSQTRAEALQFLIDANVPDLLALTNSCAHRRGLSAIQPFCGICSQCVDRRFGVLAARLERYDPATRYKLNIFRHSLPEGTPRTMAESYVRWAQQVEPLMPEGLFDQYPELFDCIQPDDPAPQITGEALAGVLKRHAVQTVQVMAEQIASAKDELARAQLPPDCLIRLAQWASSATVPAEEAMPNFRASEDYRSVSWQGQEFRFTATQAKVVRLLREAQLSKTPEIGQDQLLEKAGSQLSQLRDLFRRNPAWRKLIISGSTRGSFRLSQ